jgi:putative PIN family toxin of toxin-antitoxin system
MSMPSLTPHTSPLAVVLDTNVVLDVLVFDDGVARPLAEALATGALVPWADEKTLQELEWVLAMPTFKLAAPERREVFARYRSLVRLCAQEAPAPGVELELPRCRDRDDQKFLQLAARSGAAWLVSKDKRVLSMADRHGLPFVILAPKQAARELTRTS